MTKTRIITGTILLAFLIPLVLIGGIPFTIFVYIGAMIATLELINMYSTKKSMNIYTKAVILILTTTVFVAGIISYPNSGSNYQVIAPALFSLLLFASILTYSAFVFSADLDGDDVGKIFTIMFYSGFGFASFVILRNLGLAFVGYMLFAVFLTDIFAYVFGRLFGKHKMSPNISPKKTWEGLIGGVLVASLFTTFFAMNYTIIVKPINGFETLLEAALQFELATSSFVIMLITFGITIIMSLVAQLGDLVASKLKRTYDIKDYGKVFPGHGGVLDRFDSTIFASMFLVSIITFINFTGSSLILI